MKKGEWVTIPELFGAAPGVKDTDSDFNKISIARIFGNIWSRAGLELRDRSLIMVAALMAMGSDRELTYHMAGAKRQGIQH